MEDNSVGTAQSASPVDARPNLADSPIRGRATLSADDFKRAWLELPQTRRLMASSALTSLGVFVLLAGFESAGPSPFPLFGVLVLVSGWSLYNSRSRFLKNGLQGGDGKAAEYIFDERGFRLIAPDSELQVAWTALHRQIQTNSVFLLLTSPQVGNIVLKRAFSAEDQRLLAAELNARIPNRRQYGPLVGRLALCAALLVGFYLVLTTLTPSHPRVNPDPQAHPAKPSKPSN